MRMSKDDVRQERRLLMSQIREYGKLFTVGEDQTEKTHILQGMVDDGLITMEIDNSGRHTKRTYRPSPTTFAVIDGGKA